MLKTFFQKDEPKRLIYRDYTSFSKDSLLTDLSNSIENFQCYEALETKTVEVLDKHAPRKTKFLRGNHKPRVSKKLKKEIMKRSQLKSFANKTSKDIDLYKFRKQRNLVVNLNKKEKKNFLNFIPVGNDSKPFWEKYLPYFSNKRIKTWGNIILSDKDGLIFKKIEVAEEFNIHFQSITSSLGLSKWPDSSELLNEPDQIKSIVKKYKSHPSIKKSRANTLQLILFLSDQLLPRVFLMLFLH